jgi:RimJ/RimL family protein N-acetyltransferase
MLKRATKRIAEILFAPYELNRVYGIDLRNYDKPAPSGFDLRKVTSAEEISGAADSLLREHAWYAGENAFAFGLWDGDSLVCSCVFWDHRRFHDSSLMTLGEGEAIMVDLVTAPKWRGRGYAPLVIRFAETELKRGGFERLYSWVWHSNEPSKRAFEKAGWSYIAFVVKVTPLGLGKTVRLERRIRRFA